MVEEYACEHVPGSGDVGLIFGDPSEEATWGSSYAISTEWWDQLGYDSECKAAANVYGGKRVIKVCTWCTRPKATPTPRS